MTTELNTQNTTPSKEVKEEDIKHIASSQTASVKHAEKENTNKTTIACSRLANKAHETKARELDDKEIANLITEHLKIQTEGKKIVSINNKPMQNIKDELIGQLQHDINIVGKDSPEGQLLAQFLEIDQDLENKQSKLESFTDVKFRQAKVLQKHFNSPKFQKQILEAKNNPQKIVDIMDKLVQSSEVLFQDISKDHGIARPQLSDEQHKQVAGMVSMVKMASLAATTAPVKHQELSSTEAKKPEHHQVSGSDSTDAMLKAFKVLMEILLLIGNLCNELNVKNMDFSSILNEESLHQIEETNKKNDKVAADNASKSTCQKVENFFTELAGAIMMLAALATGQPELAIMGLYMILQGSGAMSKMIEALAKATGSKVLAHLIVMLVLLVVTMGASAGASMLEEGAEAGLKKFAGELLTKKMAQTVVMQAAMTGLLGDGVYALAYASAKANGDSDAEAKKIATWTAAIVSAVAMVGIGIAQAVEQAGGWAKVGSKLKSLFNSGLKSISKVFSREGISISDLKALLGDCQTVVKDAKKVLDEVIKDMKKEGNLSAAAKKELEALKKLNEELKDIEKVLSDINEEMSGDNSEISNGLLKGWVDDTTQAMKSPVSPVYKARDPKAYLASLKENNNNVNANNNEDVNENVNENEGVNNANINANVNEAQAIIQEELQFIDKARKLLKDTMRIVTNIDTPQGQKALKICRVLLRVLNLLANAGQGGAQVAIGSYNLDIASLTKDLATLLGELETTKTASSMNTENSKLIKTQNDETMKEIQTQIENLTQMLESEVATAQLIASAH